MTMIKRQEFVAQLGELIRERKGPGLGLLPEDMDLLKAGLIDSFMLIELIIHIERMSGLPFQTEGLKMQDLRTLGSIYEYVTGGVQ